MPAPEIPLPPEPDDENEHVVGEYRPATELVERRAAEVARQRRPAPSTKGTQPELREDDDEWPAPQPLLQYADPLPVDALGNILGPMVRAVAHTYQVPSDIAVTMALPLVTTAAAGRWTVKVRDGWTETLALATMSILGSSGGKSPTLKKLAAPLQEFETEAMAAAAGDYARSKALHDVMKDRADKLRTEIKGIAEHKLIENSPQHKDYLEVQQRYVEACQAIEDHQIKAPPRWMFDDITPEALALRMSEQDGAVGIVSAEPGLFGTLGGRYSQGVANLDVVLKGVSGDRIQIDRKTNGVAPIIINHPVLSISLGVQPGMMRRLGERDEFRESGMLGRFLPVMPRSLMGARLLDTNGVPDEVDERWWEAVQNLARFAEDLRSGGHRRELMVKPDAEAKLREFREHLEPEFLEGGRLEHLVDFGGKLAGAAVRIAGGLTLLADPSADVIEPAVMADALRVADAYIDHAHTAFGTLSGGDPSSPLARMVRWLIERREPLWTHRDIHYEFKHKPWAKTSKDLTALMEALEARGWVRKGRRDAGAKGGRPSVVWEVNPRAFDLRPRDVMGPSMDPALAIDHEDGAA